MRYHPYISPPMDHMLSKIYPVSSITTHFSQILPKGLFRSGFPTNILNAFLDSSMRATCTALLSRLVLRFMLGEEYKACSSALFNFHHSPVNLALLAPNIYLSTLFWNTLNLLSFFKVRD